MIHSCLTRALILLFQFPTLPSGHSKRVVLEGDVPSPKNPPKASFSHQVSYALEACKEVIPDLVEIKPNQYAAAFGLARSGLRHRERSPPEGAWPPDAPRLIS